MAYVREGIGDNDSGIGQGLSLNLIRAARWVAFPCAAAVFACGMAAALAGLHSSRASTASLVQVSLSAEHRPGLLQGPVSASAAALAAPAEKPARLAARLPASPKPQPAPAAQAAAPAQAPADPFARAAAEAGPTRAKLLAALEGAGIAVPHVDRPVELAAVMPVAERFHGAPTAPEKPSQRAVPLPEEALASRALGAGGRELQLAYASVEPGWDDPLSLALATHADDAVEESAGSVLDQPETPESVELPDAKPEMRPAAREPAVAAKPEAAPKPAVAAAGKPKKPATSDREQATAGRSQREQTLAYAKPDKPGIGAFKNLFNGPKAGKGVAIYDISAAVVHMPDGSKLEAHSGIGKMADNPRYVHVKMNGPTPPNTYKLSMREKRFYGVEAIRMTPVGEQTMHGRDGILAHSYLLRGGRAESHGCVAFADYQRFLKAFKQGKVTHIVVVPSMKKMPKVRVASLERRT